MAKDPEIRRLKRKQRSICHQECQEELEKGTLGDQLVDGLDETLADMFEEQEQKRQEIESRIDSL